VKPVLSSQRIFVVLSVAVVVVALLGGCSTKTQRLYRRAEAFFAQGQYELAAREYSRIVQEAPRDPLADDAWYKLAYLYREELDNPSAALIVYRDLADSYEDSNYADEVLFWIVYLQHRYMQDPVAAVATCRELDQRFPDKKDLRGQAYLEAAGAYQDVGQLEQAYQLYQQITDDFAERPIVAAQALLMSADITDKIGKDPQQALALYEQVVEKYPGTQAAVTARQVVGLRYYVKKAETDKARLAMQRQQARVLGNVPPLKQYPDQPAMELLAAIHSLLSQAGGQISMDEVVVISGLPFTLTFAVDRPELAQAFYRNPATAIAEEVGFGYNLWTSATPAGLFDNATSCLLQDRPLLIAYGAGTAHWCLITGYRPAEKELYLLQPGAEHAVKLDPQAFLEVWQSSKVPALWPQGALSGFRFALTVRRRPADTAATIKSVLLQSSLAWQQRELMRQPAGSAACDELVKLLRKTIDARNTASRKQLKAWASTAIPLIISSRQAAARFFAQPPQGLLDKGNAPYQEVSQRYDTIVAAWQELSRQIEQAPAETEPSAAEPERPASAQHWQQALEQAQKLARVEPETLRWLASSLAE